MNHPETPVSAPQSTLDAPSASRPDSIHDFRRAVFGLRLRALLVGIPLLIAISFISVYADMVSKLVQFGVQIELVEKQLSNLSLPSAMWYRR